jgi:hypothetical protein
MVELPELRGTCSPAARALAVGSPGAAHTARIVGATREANQVAIPQLR